MKAAIAALGAVLLLIGCGTADTTGGVGGAGGSGGAGTGGGCSASADACLGCCGTAHPEGSTTFATTVKACACGSGACASECSDAGDYCQGGPPSAECNSCVTSSWASGACSSDPCGKDTDCEAYIACANGCSADGNSTGMAATTTTTTGTTTPATTSTGSAGMYEDATEDCLNDINMYRATLGVPAYTRWTANETCTDGQAQADGMANVAHSAFGQCMESAQDECPGWPAPASTMIGQCLAQMWAEGPGTDFNTHGHYINMSSTQYTMVSCGFFTMPDGSIWATQDFK